MIAVVSFRSDADIIYERGTRLLDPMEAHDNGRTNFSAALHAAIPIIQGNRAGYECRILFFTDREGGTPTNEVAEMRRTGVRLDAIGFGSIRQDGLPHLVTCGETVSIEKTMNDVQQVFARIAAT